jgi:hypothetical protein
MEYFRIVEVSSTEEEIHQTGVDSHFILWSLAFVLSVSLFIVISIKLLSQSHPKNLTRTSSKSLLVI